MSEPPIATIYVVSDGRGDTGAKIVEAALVQFAGQRPDVVREAVVRTPERVQAAVEAAARANAVVFYTLVEETTRRAMEQACARLAVPAVDVMGPALKALHDLFHIDPRAQPGLVSASEREEIERHDAIAYTLKHDDGRRPDELGQADVVLVGVSRSCKSATCFFLAYQGIKAANVPLLPGQAPPAQLLALPAEKVVGLRVNPSRLLSVRAARAQHLDMDPISPYLDRDAVLREVREAHRLMEERRWRSFDVSYLAVEEIAREVLQLRRLPERSLG